MQTLEKIQADFRNKIKHCFSRAYPDGAGPDATCEYYVRNGDRCKIMLTVQDRSEKVKIIVSDIEFGRSHNYTCTLWDLSQYSVEQIISRALDEYLYVLKDEFYADIAVADE